MAKNFRSRERLSAWKTARLHATARASNDLAFAVGLPAAVSRLRNAP
jgi:hypothetical protein